jgi:dephospho-CoA kinase
MLTAARLHKIEYDIAVAAAANILRGAVVGAVITGKMASGKDTVAARVAALRDATTKHPTVIHRVSDPIRAELAQANELIANASNTDSAHRALVEVMDMPSEPARHIVDELFEMSRSAELNAEVRTNSNRHLLQFLADNVRRAVDPEYWVHQALASVYQELADGASTAILTGGRYPNEVQPAQTLGLTVIRIEVALEVQIARIHERDGIAPDPALFLDPNECALDEYVGFNVVVENNAEPEPTITVVHEELESHLAALAA